MTIPLDETTKTQPLDTNPYGSPDKAQPKSKSHIEKLLQKPVTVGSLLVVALVGGTMFGTISLGSKLAIGYFSAKECESDLNAYKNSGRATDGFMAENSGAIINACFHGATLREALNAAEVNYYRPAGYSSDFYFIRGELRDISDDIDKLLRYR